MSRFFFILWLAFEGLTSNAQNSLPGTYVFDDSPTSIYAQIIYNDTIVCMGVVFKDVDTIKNQQGLFIALIDTCGNLIRIKKYFDPLGRDILLNLTNQIIRTAEGGYCFIGRAGDNNLFIKANCNGDVVIAKDYPPILGFDDCYFLTIHEIQNYFYSLGYGDNFEPYRDDIFFVKFDQAGNLLDSKRFETPENCEYFGDAITQGTNIIVATVRTNDCISGGLRKAKTRIFEIDTTGEILSDWVDENSNLRRGGGAGLTRTEDGGWIYGGIYIDTFYFGNQYTRPFVTKIDSNFNHEWTQVFGYQDIGYNGIRDIAIDANGNYVVAGQYAIGYPDFPSPNRVVAAFIANIKPDGEILWSNYAKAFQTEGPDTGQVMFTYNINLLSSGNIIIGGPLYRIIDLAPQSEGWLAKISPSGEVLDDPDPFCGLVSVQQPSLTQNDIICFPNPTTDQVTFSLSLSNNISARTLFLLDVHGRIDKTVNIPIGDISIMFTVKDITPGIYLWKVIGDQGLLKAGSLIIQH